MFNLNKLLNVSSREWSRILVAWGMTFLTRFGFIIGWTVLVATFLGKVGIDYLPVLFLSNAVLVMLGTLIFRKFIHLIRRELLITLTVLAAAALLISSIGFIQTNTLYFFILLLIAESVLLAQLSILLSLFNEDMFSPLESQRTFPVIESAETIGGIIGGLVLSVLGNSLPSYKFIIIWAIALIFILPIVLKYNPSTMEIPKLHESKDESEEPHKKTNKKIHESFFELQKIPFLRGLMLVVILHWSIMNMVEFQYTKAIQQEVYDVQEQTLVLEENLEENKELTVTKIAVGKIPVSTTINEEIILAETQNNEINYEHALTQRLGMLHVLFNAVALVIQLIIASRILTSLGVISSMMLHPLLTLLNLIGLTFRFGFGTAVLTRGSYELTGIIFKNSYDSSYYAIPHSKRDDAKELMQGIMKPLGAIIGTVLIIGVALKLTGIEQTLALNTILIGMCLIMTILVATLSRKYTEMSEHNLSKKLDLPTRLNAIEILAQKGHEKSTPSLEKILARPGEPEILRMKIIKTLGENRNTQSISSILEMLKHENDNFRLAAAQALTKFDKLKKNIMKQSFTKQRVIETMKEVLKKEPSSAIREEIVKYFFEIAPEELTKFLLESIRTEKKLRPSFIRMLRFFKDPNLKYYLEEYLDNKSPEIKAASIITLWQFENIRGTLSHHIKQMLESKRPSMLLAGIEASGQIQFEDAKAVLKKHLTSANKEIRETALLALAQMEDESVIPHLIGIFADPEHEWFHKTETVLSKLPQQFREIVEPALHIHITEIISSILKKNKKIHKLEKQTLHLLKALYQKINAHHEAHKLSTMLDKHDS